MLYERKINQNKSQKLRDAVLDFKSAVLYGQYFRGRHFHSFWGGVSPMYGCISPASYGHCDDKTPFMEGGWHGAMDIVQEPAIEDLGWRPFLLLCPLSL